MGRRIDVNRSRLRQRDDDLRNVLAVWTYAQRTPEFVNLEIKLWVNAQHRAKFSGRCSRQRRKNILQSFMEQGPLFSGFLK